MFAQRIKVSSYEWKSQLGFESLWDKKPEDINLSYYTLSSFKDKDG